MKNKKGIIYGTLLIIAAVLLALNWSGILEFDIFFEGWWTLFIIIPSFIGIIEKRNKTGSSFALLLGILLLLQAQGVLRFQLGKALIVALVAYIGIKLIVSSVRRNKHKTKKDRSHMVINQDVRAIDIDISCADLKITDGDSFDLYSSLENMTMKQKDGVLKIKQSDNAVISKESTREELCLTVPGWALLDSINLSCGAGEVQIDALRANDIELELGAGKAEIRYVQAQRCARIEAGVGNITISDGIINDLSLELGVGRSYIRSRFGGKSHIECGVGEASIVCVGKMEDHTLDIEQGLGSIHVNGEKITEERRFGNGSTRISIDGGVGRLDIDFENA